MTKAVSYCIFAKNLAPSDGFSRSRTHTNLGVWSVLPYFTNLISTLIMAQKQTAEKIDKKTTGSNKEAMPLTKMNYIMIAVCIVLIALGFALMAGSSNQGDTFNNEVFSSTRIVVAPFITFLGFILMVPAIIYRGKKNSTSEQ